jgi:hypothetical protein
MNEMNFPETRLRSWQPRPPSARLKHRIFEAPAPSHSFNWSLRCLAPAAACLLVAIAAFNKGGVIPTDSARSESLLGMIGSNMLARVPGDYLQEQNCFAPHTFEWTNRSGSTSSIDSFSPGK